MAKRKQYDPLSHIPSASFVREKLAETQCQARRLEILLEVAERIEGERTGEGSITLQTSEVRPC